MPPWRQIGDRIDPTRARPVPFCFQSFLPEPLTSLLSLVLCVPARCARQIIPHRFVQQVRVHPRAKYVVGQFHLADVLPSRFFTSTTGIVVSRRFLKLRFTTTSALANENVAAGRPGTAPRTSSRFSSASIFTTRKFFDRLALIAHVPRKMLALPHARRKRTRADAARRAVMHRAVRRVAAAIVPALHAALKSLALADAGHVHQLADLESVDQHAVAGLGFVLRVVGSRISRSSASARRRPS